jgi:YidC/Oxa1 family membrane protein insertase
MEKRAILAIILTILVIVVWSILQSKFFPKPPGKPPTQEVTKEPAIPEEKRIIKKTPTAVEKPFFKAKTFPKKEVSIETQNFWAVFTSEDGGLKHFKLKKYEDKAKTSPFTIKVIQFVGDLLGRRVQEPKKPEPLDLVNSNEDKGLPLGLFFVDTSLSEGNWEVDEEQIRLLNPGEKGKITFSKVLENGLKVLKRYGFESEQYTIDLEVEVQNNTSQEVTMQLGLDWIGKMELAKLADEGNKDYGIMYAFMKNEKVERKNLGGASSSGCAPGCSSRKRSVEPFEFSDKGAIRWFSFGGEYFTALLISPPPAKEITLTVKGDEGNFLKADLIAPKFSIPAKEDVKIPYQVYLGPKDEAQLKRLGVDAGKLVNFGYFTIIAKPILWFLNLTHSVTKNFGVDIIIISILIKIIFLPLTQISMKSMKEMQKIQPEMKRLQEQYKNDKAKLQQEMMLLYKRRKINPMSGCLPMLIQIPVFFALYNVLQNAIEMRHAPFLLWIRDLAAKDPLYISPIIMGASMVIQQKMTPTATDPTQAKMFLLMPIMFTFIFLSLPSGLVLYWLVNNVLSIAHQYYLNKKT